ncbi:MAG: carboxypeptidase-like regulatory domain-containing protein [Pyrinomonadaceae bacterium]
MSRLSKIILIAVFAAASSFILPPSSFAQSGAIKGKVRSNKGDGIANASVTARQSGKDIKTVRSNAKGDFLLAGLSTGVYSLVFDADGFQSGLLQGVEVKSGDTRSLGDRLVLMPDQGNQVIINGSVFYKEGTSLGGAKIEIERMNADGTSKKVTTLYTNIRGEFTFRQPQGSAKFRITAMFKGAEGVKEVEVDTAAIYRLAITLDISRTEK